MSYNVLILELQSLTAATFSSKTTMISSQDLTDLTSGDAASDALGVWGTTTEGTAGALGPLGLETLGASYLGTEISGASYSGTSTEGAEYAAR